MNQPVKLTAAQTRELIEERYGKTFIPKLHADFKMVSENRQKEGEWTKDDARDIGLSIKVAIDAGNLAMVVFWADHLNVIASQYVGFKAALLAAEARILSQARRDREAREGAGKAAA